MLLINKKIAHINIKTEYDNYRTFCAQKDSLKIKCSEAKKKVDWAQMKLKTLQEKSSDVGLAIEKINNALNYIFFTSGRFSVELKENKYYLKSNGENVLPKNISVGERNIIALCYFFTQIMSNKDTNAFYQDENLIIIDDPVSSFDFENKVGIISYLRYQIDSIIFGNKNSRVVVFSHDLETIYHLEKVGSEICNKSNSNSNVKKFKLENKVLRPCPKGISGEYESLLRKIFNFATNEDNESLEIGNIIRRVLEAFSSFVYKEGIEKISLNTDVLSVLENHSKFFENLMYRLVLHGESHYEEQIKSMHDNFNFYKFISEDEKRDIAKHILCFLYLLNKAHLKAYLIDKKAGDIQNVEDTIKKWLKDIPTNDKFES
ncbi:MAG: AAA family ATPase [Alphaproteobacteria bacterium]|nr:AAA family ATPase [Alphaproteobacteria bacterium]